jgi:hypothetical protein
MKKILFCWVFLLSAHLVIGWGQTGHRVIGHIAEQYLTPKAKKEVKRVLGNESLAIVSTWMDDIKSDRAYDHTHDWHWVTIPDGQTYEETEKNPKGDIVESIERLTKELKGGKLDAKTESEHLKMLVHLVGDIHQPFHVGRGDDKGGNDVRVEWFRERSNIHRVWDSQIIDGKQLSYTELANVINFATPEEVKKLQSANVYAWAYESMSFREQIYNIPEDGRIGYEYSYYNYPLVQRRLKEAGIRLAGVINDIYK